MAAWLNSGLANRLAAAPWISYRKISLIRVGFLPETWIPRRACPRSPAGVRVLLRVLLGVRVLRYAAKNQLSAARCQGVARCRSCRDSPTLAKSGCFAVRPPTTGQNRMKFGLLRAATGVKDRVRAALDTSGIPEKGHLYSFSLKFFRKVIVAHEAICRGTFAPGARSNWTLFAWMASTVRRHCV